MSIDPELLEFFSESVTLSGPPGAKNLYTEQAAGAAVVYAARCEGKIQKITDANGRERVSQVSVYLPSWPSGLTPDWAITLPARFSPVSPEILSVQFEPDVDGTAHHAVVLC